MGRIRTIKPDFFLDDELDELDEKVQKLFVGLWVLADREGRLADQPKRIKAQIFPYRDYDVDAMLAELHGAGFIHRYEAAGVAYVEIDTFREHQRPHPKEIAFGYPPAPESVKSREVTRKGMHASRVVTRVVTHGEGKGREGKEILDNGKEILDPAGKKKKPPAEPASQDPDWSSCVDGLYATFERIRGTKPVPRPKDWKALQRLRLRIKESNEEIDRRWAQGLQGKFSRECHTFWDLNEKWDALATDEPAPSLRATGTDVTRGFVRAESQKHTGGLDF